MIIEYMLNREVRPDGLVMTTPPWVTNGGQILNPTDKTMMGFCPSLANRDYYLPDSVTILTLAQAKARALGIHAITPFTKPGDTPIDRVEMTTGEVEAMVEAIVTAGDVA